MVTAATPAPGLGPAAADFQTFWKFAVTPGVVSPSVDTNNQLRANAPKLELGVITLCGCFELHCFRRSALHKLNTALKF